MVVPLGSMSRRRNEPEPLSSRGGIVVAAEKSRWPRLTSTAYQRSSPGRIESRYCPAPTAVACAGAGPPVTGVPTGL